MSHESTRDGQQRSDLTEGELNSTNNEADGHIAKQSAKGASGLNGPAETKEETSADCAGNGEHGQVTLLEATTEVGILGGSEEIAVIVV